MSSNPSRRARCARSLVWWLLLPCALCACRRDSPARSQPASASSAAEPADAAQDWAAHVGQSPLTAAAQSGLPPSAAAIPDTPIASIQPATMPDHEFEAAGNVPVRHLVYRVSFIVPPSLREKQPPLRAPAGELHIDVARERLRARFVGPGWPLEPGTELRLRADVPGVYLFDGMGGRPLPPGELAKWFQGTENGHAKAAIGIRRDSGSGDHGPGDLLCALLAEWTQQDRDELLPRCQNGALPLGFHFGLWTAELTAIVPLSMARSKLRADAGHPPNPIRYATGQAMLEPADIARLPPMHLRPRMIDGELKAPPPEPDLALGPEGAVLDVDNRSDARVVIVISGVPVAWVRGHASMRIAGFKPGYYRIGASRPFGQPAMSGTLTHIPGTLRFGRAN